MSKIIKYFLTILLTPILFSVVLLRDTTFAIGIDRSNEDNTPLQTEKTQKMTNKEAQTNEVALLNESHLKAVGESTEPPTEDMQQVEAPASSDGSKAPASSDESIGQTESKINDTAVEKNTETTHKNVDTKTTPQQMNVLPIVIGIVIASLGGIAAWWMMRKNTQKPKSSRKK